MYMEISRAAIEWSKGSELRSLTKQEPAFLIKINSKLKAKYVFTHTYKHTNLYNHKIQTIKIIIYLSLIISISVPISLEFAFHFALILSLPHHDCFLSLLLFSFSLQSILFRKTKFILIGSWSLANMHLS